MDGSLNDSFVINLIDHSYELVVAKLTKKDQAVIRAHQRETK